MRIQGRLVGLSGIYAYPTILAGEHKGELVSMQAEGLGVDEIDALGTPGTLTVADGQPNLVLE